MKILVLNCGSSSIKYKLFEMGTKSVFAQGGIEKIGLNDSFLKITLPQGEKVIFEQEITDHTSGVGFILKMLTDKKYGCIESFSEIQAVGHRVVHGGEKFNSSVKLTQEVINKIEECIDIAPLHNPANLNGIMAIKKLLPQISQVAVFDTAFHQTMPDYAYTYALPYEYYLKYGIRRYGFHGTSHRYVSERACKFLGLDQNNSKIITAHIGNGGSIAAIKNGKSVDTSMGLTPVEGLMMGTRSGDVDLGVITYLMNKEQMNVEKIADIINKQSGLLGVSGVSSDMRDIYHAIEEGNKRAELALKMYIHHIKKYIGAYVAVLNGVDAIVFTGGVGENQAPLREKFCEEMSYLGIECDKKTNASTHGVETEITTPKSRVKVLVIPTDEELMIATDTLSLLNSGK